MTKGGAARAQAEVAASPGGAAAPLADAPVAVHAVGRDGTILWANRAALDLAGCAEHEYLGRPLADLHADREVAADLLRRLAGGEALRDFPARLRGTDGAVRDVLVSAGAPSGDRAPFPAHCFIIDVTAQRRLEEELARERRRFDAVLRQMPSAVAIVEAPSGRTLLANNQNEIIFRCKIPPSIGVADYGRFTGYHADGRAIAPQEWPIARSIATGEVVRGEEVRVLRGDGGEAWIRINAAPVRDENGRIVAGVVTYDDVSEQRRAQQAMQESEQRLHAILESSTSVIYLKDLEGRHLTVNRQYELVAGVPREQILGKTDAELVGPEIARGFRADDLRVIETGASIQVEHAFVHRGELRTFLTTKFPLLDASGRVYAVGGMSTDITDRKKAEDAAGEGERQLRLVTDALPVLVTLVGADGRYRFVNRAYESWFGQPRDSLVGKTVAEVVGEAAARELRPHIEAVLAGREVSFQADMAYRHGNRTISATYVPHRAADGAVDAFVALVSDVTAHKRADDRIRFLAEASAILSSSLDYSTTLKSVASLAVPRLADWCVVEMALPQGGSEQLAVAHVDPAKVELAAELRRRYPTAPDAPNGVPNVLRTGKSEIYQDITDDLLVKSARDEEHLRVIRALSIRSIVIIPIASRGKVAGAITLVSAESGRRFDAADVALAEELGSRAGLAIDNATLYGEAQQAVRNRDDFLSVASHELKTPLTTLRLQVDGLLRAAAKGRLDKLPLDAHMARLAKLGLQIDRITTLVNQLLDVSRISAGRLAIDPADVDLGELVPEIAARFAEEAQQAGSPLVVDAGAPARGRWDRNRIDQVITNLLSNAVKYGERRPVRIAVGVAAGVARVTVEDEGLGIAAADQRRIFDRFERTESARNFPGLGLGLWISKQIVEAHGGRIVVRSAPGQGTIFTIELPTALVENAGP